jgi:hypothetical protein
MVARDQMTDAFLSFPGLVLPNGMFAAVPEVRSKALEDGVTLPKVSPHFLGVQKQPA